MALSVTAGAAASLGAATDRAVGVKLPALAMNADPEDGGGLNAIETELAERVAAMSGFDGGPYRRPKRDTGWSSTSKWPGQPLTFWWRGPVPDDIMDLIDSARKDVDININVAENSYVDLKEKTAKLVRRAGNPSAEPSTKLNDANFQISSISYPDDGRGIHILWKTANKAKQKASHKKVKDVVREVSGLEVLTAAETEVQSASRENATSPWKAGMDIRDYNNLNNGEAAGVHCTSAFGVTRTFNSVIRDMFFTAAHCIETDPDQFSWYNGGGALAELVACDRVSPLGNIQGSIVRRDLDAALLVVQGLPGPFLLNGTPNVNCNRGSVSNQYYTGVWDAGTGSVPPPTTYKVEGFAATTSNGLMIRTSGASSGEHLQIVEDIRAEFPCDTARTPTLMCGGVLAHPRTPDPSRTFSPIGTINGDSGGPVVKTLTKTDGTKVMVALGIINAGTEDNIDENGDGTVDYTTDTTCNPTSDDDVRGTDSTRTDCSYYVYYTQIPTLLTAFSATLKP